MDYEMPLGPLPVELDQITPDVLNAALSHRFQNPAITALRIDKAHHGERTAIVDWAYTLEGSTPVYDGSSLQTRFRDIHVATQHAACHTDAYCRLGAAMLGVELTPHELF